MTVIKSERKLAIRDENDVKWNVIGAEIEADGFYNKVYLKSETGDIDHVYQYIYDEGIIECLNGYGYDAHYVEE